MDAPRLQLHVELEALQLLQDAAQDTVLKHGISLAAASLSVGHEGAVVRTGEALLQLMLDVLCIATGKNGGV